MATKKYICPLTDLPIDEYECYLVSEAAEGMIPSNEMPGKQDFEIESKICLKCSKHSVE